MPNGALNLVVSNVVSRRLQHRINRPGAPKRFQTLVDAFARSDALLVCQRILRLGVTHLGRHAYRGRCQYDIPRSRCFKTGQNQPPATQAQRDGVDNQRDELLPAVCRPRGSPVR